MGIFMRWALDCLVSEVENCKNGDFTEISKTFYYFRLFNPFPFQNGMEAVKFEVVYIESGTTMSALFFEHLA